VLVPRHSEVYGRVYCEAQNGTELHEKLAPANRIEGTGCRDFVSIFAPSVFSSAEWFGTEIRKVASIFVSH
jgi:hypothetical protein